jgi:hypothetical protein
MHAETTGQRSTKPIIARNKFLAYFLGIIAAFFLCLLLARVTFPGSYSILENSVSNLGRQDSNIAGWYFFTAALWITAVGLVPYYLLLVKVLGSMNKVVAGIMFILYCITSVGLFMAGLFQEGSEQDRLHLLSAYFGFGGFFLAGIFTWILLGMKLAKHDGNKTKHVVAFVVAIASLSTGAIMFITHLLLHEADVINFDGDPYGPFIGFSFTEWLLVITIFVDKLLIGMIIASFLPKKKV